MTEQNSLENTRSIHRKITSLTANEWKKLRDGSSDWQEWCLYNACMRLREALSKNNLQDVEIWEYIAMELAKNVDDFMLSRF